MLEALKRKTLQITHDPVLRRWLLRTALDGSLRGKVHVAGRPPYLDDVATEQNAAPSSENAASFSPLEAAPPGKPLDLDLPGETLSISPDKAASIFSHTFKDIESSLAVQRFAWVPLAGPDIDQHWVDALWRNWIDAFGEPSESWAWHPYTATERAINILDFSQRFGVPGEIDRTLAVLADHIPAITQRLEYFGEQGTGNHLSNNGRGLYFLGLHLGNPPAADTGARILLSEADRLFGPAGILREGSSHYHMLLTRNYVSAWLVSRRFDRPEAEALMAIAGRALAALSSLDMPARFPLVGDISPDCPPSFLRCLLPQEDINSGWAALLSEEEKAAIETLKGDCAPISTELLAANGWVRMQTGPWSCLWHAAPDGWPPMPGHAHQDMGSFELHWNDTPIFVDPGRGSYCDIGAGLDYSSGPAHNTLLIDGQDPYPVNKPYYGAAFRSAVAAPPRVMRTQDGVSITHSGFSRLSAVGEVARNFSFKDHTLTIADRIEGKNRHRVTRRLHTPLPATREGNNIILTGETCRVCLSMDADVSLEDGLYWTAYGKSAPATVIDISSFETLPKRLRLTISVEQAIPRSKDTA